MYDIDIDSDNGTGTGTDLEALCREPDRRARAPGLATVSGSVGAGAPDAAGAPAGGQHGQVAAAAGRAPASQAYWRDRYGSDSYCEPGSSFEDYAPACELASSRRAQAGGDQDFDAAEPELRQAWESSRDGSSLTWEQARAAMRAAWHRVDVDLDLGPGDAARR